MTSVVRVSEEWHGDVPIARIEGEVDAANVAEVAARLRRLMTNRAMRLIVDLTATTYLDSAGINLLFELNGELDARQQRLHVVVPPSAPITRALEITGFDAAVATHPTREAALAGATSAGSDVAGA